MDAAAIVEGDALVAHAPSGPPTVGFAAFLDGIQQSRIGSHLGMVPVVFGTIAAVVRERRARRMVTRDAPAVDRAVYAPIAQLPPGLAAELAVQGLIDTEPRGLAHPAALVERALQVVKRRREELERQLAADAARTSAPLWIDGALTVAHPDVVGVVKTHRTLYVAPDGFGVLAALRAGERTSVLRIASAHRAPVLSWYLRLREAAGRGPFWGLVRVEMAEGGAVAERADRFSRWVLAEASPLALPDPRWDTLVYGVRDCEEYLRAVC